MDPLVFRLRLLELATEYERLHAAGRESPPAVIQEPPKTALRQISSGSDVLARAAPGRERPARVLVLDPTFASEATCASDDADQAAPGEPPEPDRAAGRAGRRLSLEERLSDDSAQQLGRAAPHQKRRLSLEERPSDDSSQPAGRAGPHQQRRTGSIESDTSTARAAANPYGSEISAGSAGEALTRRQKRTVTWESLGYKSSGRGSGRHSSVIEGSAETDATLATMATARGRAQFDMAVKKSLSDMGVKMSLSRVSSGDLSGENSRQTVDGRPLAWFVQSCGFSVAFAMLIVMSAMLIGIETQLLSSLSYQRAASEQVLTALSVANYVLTFLFTLEMAARLYVFRSDFFVRERVWNCFDLVILVLALVEVSLELGHLAPSRRGIWGSSGRPGCLQLAASGASMGASTGELKPLRMLVHSILFAGRSVFWALTLLFMIIFSFGVILTQAATEHTEGGLRVDDEDLVSYFGDLNRSMIHLWMAVSGDLDLTIDAQLMEKQMYIDRLKMLFQEMSDDPDAAGDELTAAQLHFQLAKPKEFVEGCLRLRGSATRVDVASLKWEIRGAKRGAEKSAEFTARKLEEVAEGLGDLRASLGLPR
ncbi:unnamed protein product [Prorocentrum cordatum]|uniref:Ion transport domain-containing protein n=1 Tax=Prorocentrum cordatum TaxID=2364126 RepID=A0ABN9SH65_9DINO|nr:unnamed protein product [Polarella glacialis]